MSESRIIALWLCSWCQLFGTGSTRDTTWPSLHVEWWLKLRERWARNYAVYTDYCKIASEKNVPRENYEQTSRRGLLWRNCKDRNFKSLFTTQCKGNVTEWRYLKQVIGEKRGKASNCFPAGKNGKGRESWPVKGSLGLQPLYQFPGSIPSSRVVIFLSFLRFVELAGISSRDHVSLLVYMIFWHAQ